MNLAFFPFLPVIYRNRRWLLISILIFILGFFSLYFLQEPLGEEQMMGLDEEAMGFFEEIAEFITQTHPTVGALLIFINNLISSLQMLFLGVILGLSPLFTLLLNGGILGLLSTQVIDQGMSVWFLVVGILPHGIPELAAFFLCAAMGLKLGFHTVVSPLPGKTRKESFKYIWKEIISILPVVIVLLFVAAFIEIFLTQYLMHIFF